MALTNQSGVKPEISLRITRTFDASSERVFNAWLDPVQVSKWMGPRSCQACVEAKLIEPRVGGRYLLHMRMPGGNKDITGVYREITRHTKLVFTWTWSAECGNPANCAGEDTMANRETLITVTFRPVGTQTEMTLLHENFPTEEARDGHDKGWSSTFDQLAVLMASNTK